MPTTQWVTAIKKAAVWGTQVAVGANSGFKIESESMGEGLPEPIPDDNVGDILSGGTMQGNVPVEGSIVCPMRYEGPTSELLMAMLMGTSNAGSGSAPSAPEEIELGIAYLHHMVFQAANTGLFATMMFDKKVTADKQYNYTTVKPSQVDFGHSNGKTVGTFTMLAHSVERGGTNADTQSAAVTHLTDSLLSIFQHFTLFLAEITGTEDNMDAGDEINVTDAKVTVNRNISGEYESGSNAGYIGEPDLNGFPEAMFEFTVQDYKSGVIDTLIESYQTIQTGRIPKVYKASLIWTGDDIPTTATSSKFFMRFDFPAVTLVTAPTNAGSPGAKVPVTINMKVQTPQTATLPDGTEWAWSTAGTDPFRFQVQNSRNVSLLA